MCQPVAAGTSKKAYGRGLELFTGFAEAIAHAVRC